MPDRTTPTATIPPGVERILRQFRMLGREEKMQALVSFSRKLEPVPDRFRDLPRNLPVQALEVALVLGADDLRENRVENHAGDRTGIPLILSQSRVPRAAVRPGRADVKNIPETLPYSHSHQ